MYYHTEMNYLVGYERTNMLCVTYRSLNISSQRFVSYYIKWHYVPNNFIFPSITAF